MDDRLQKALAFSNYHQTLSVQRKNLKEKADAKLTYGAHGGIFKIDQTLICFVQFLLDRGRTSNVPLIDSNGNPTLIPDLQSFSNEILDRYFTVVLEFYEDYEQIKKSRSVESLIDL